jgi:hypothetical protein
MAKEILLFDPEKGFYKLEVPEDLEPFPHLLNEAYVLGLSILHEDDDGTFALGIEQVGGAVTPWFENLEELEEFCLQPESREAMRAKKSRLTS